MKKQSHFTVAYWSNLQFVMTHLPPARPRRDNDAPLQTVGRPVGDCEVTFSLIESRSRRLSGRRALIFWRTASGYDSRFSIYESVALLLLQIEQVTLEILWHLVNCRTIIYVKFHHSTLLLPLYIVWSGASLIGKCAVRCTFHQFAHMAWKITARACACVRMCVCDHHVTTAEWKYDHWD
jgi:hypothetical protein